MSERASFGGLMIWCVAGAAVFLAVIYPVFRLFDPIQAPRTANHTSGENSNSTNRYGFGPDWQCVGSKPSGALCYQPGAFATKKGN